MIRCPACGTENKLTTKFCRECGATLAAEAAPLELENDNDRTVLLPPQADGPVNRAPGTIEQAMLLPPGARKSGDRPPPTPPDNEMTVVLPRKSAPPPPKYEPAPPTVTGPLTEPAPRSKSSRTGTSPGKSSVPVAVSKPKTPLLVVLALLVIAGGSAGYLGWLILKKNKAAVPAEKVAVAPPATPSVQPALPAAPATPVASVRPAPSAAVTPPETPAAAPPPTPKSAPQIEIPPAPVPAEPAAPPKSDATKAEKAKAEQLKKEQARLEAAKKEKLKKPAITAPTVANEPPRPAELPRSPPPLAAEPAAARQEPAPLALLRDELRACDAQNILTREFCKHQARQRRCAGMWDHAPECPLKKEDRLY